MSDAGRAEITESWVRCASLGVGPGSPLPPVELQDDELRVYRASHALAPAMPVVRRVLAEHATDDGLIVAVGDTAGRLLWLEGHSAALRRAEAINFVPGSRWSEQDAGTNAPALALQLDRPVRVRSREHLIEPVRRWSCSAAPVHDPATGARLGFIDVTGASAAASASLLALVQVTVEAVEERLRSAGPAPSGGVEVADLTVLGRRDGQLARGARRHPIPQRHAEILLLLEANPGGLSADELCVRLDERTLDHVTARAEMTRLRRIAGDDLIGSRPYRLLRPLVSDASRLRRLVERGEVAAAVRAYTGPVLPQSEAPGVVEIRNDLAAEVRAAVLLDGRPETLLAWGETVHGRTDERLWRAARAALPGGSPRLPFVLGRLDALARHGIAAPRPVGATLVQPPRH